MSYADISFLLYSPLRLLSFCPAIFPVQVRHYSLFHQHKQSDNHQDVAAVAGGFPLLQAPAPYTLWPFFALFPYYAKCKKQPLRCNENVLPFRQDKHQDIVQYRAVNSILSIFPGLTLVTLRSTLPFFCLRSSQQYNALLEIPYALAAWLMFLHLSG